MRRPTGRALAAALFGGVANAAVVTALLTRIDYPLLDSTAAIAVLAAKAVLLGFVPLLIAAHTRLLAPAGGLAALLVGTTSVELTSPDPRTVGELGGHDIVEGPFYALEYADSWHVLLGLLLVAGVAEFAIRRGYGLGDDRLRNLPPLPPSRGRLAGVVGGTAAFVGASTAILVSESAAGSAVGATLVCFVCAAAVTAVPLAAVLTSGALAPLCLFALVVPRFLLVEAFLTTDSYVHVLLFGPYAIVLAAVWTLENRLRSRFRGPGGGVVGRPESR